MESFLHLEKFLIENNTTHYMYYYVLYLWENNQIHVYKNYDSIVLDGTRELLYSAALDFCRVYGEFKP